MHPYVHAIERLFEAKVDQDFVEQTIQKLIEREDYIIQSKISECLEEMKVLERRYNMDSEQFQEKFNQGKLDDRDDYIKWFSLKDTYDRLTRLHRDLIGEDV